MDDCHAGAACVLAYDATHLGLNEIGRAVCRWRRWGSASVLGCLLAGKLSASKVEYGLLPLGALGLTVSCAGLRRDRARPLRHDRRHDVSGDFQRVALCSAQCAFAVAVAGRPPRSGHRDGQLLVYGGMVLGTFLALVLARAGVSGRGTFLVASIVLAGGFLWALSLVPDAFLRFILIGLAHTLYRVRIVGRSNIPSEGGALLVPNHVTFADGLFVIASTDRPVRFMIYANYFTGRLTGPILRSMKAIPISPSGGPKMILHAFREAGRALDAVSLSACFPRASSHGPA